MSPQLAQDRAQLPLSPDGERVGVERRNDFEEPEAPTVIWLRGRARPEAAAGPTAAAAPAEVVPLRRPATDGPLVGGQYRLCRELGRGGMGVVWEAEHVATGQRVALKILRPDCRDDAEQVGRFAQEVRATGRVAHENIVEILDFGPTDEGSTFLAMELLAGENLGTTLGRERTLSWPRIRHIMLQLCAALSAAHAAGVVHRDIKPENLFRTTRDGDPDFIKVFDFGIAKLLDREANANLTQVGQVFGTPEYMAPEQVYGARVDHRVDIYAAGVILYELLTGATPFVGPSPMAVLLQQVNDEPVPPSSRRWDPQVPPEVDAIVQRALAKNPADRFQSADELAAAIRGAEMPSAPVAPSLAAADPEPAPRPERAEAMPTPSVRPIPAQGPAIALAVAMSAALWMTLLALVLVPA